MCAEPICLLLSDHARKVLEPRIADLMESRPYRLLSIDAIGTTEQQFTANDIHVAFISRDVTGDSTKHAPAPGLVACYDTLRAARRLQWVHIHSAGADRPVFAELLGRGIAVTTSSGASAPVVAQTAVAGLLSLARRFPQLLAAQRVRRWSPLTSGTLPPDLEGQTAVIVGWGPIGQEIGRLLAAFGVRTTVVRRSARPINGVAQVVDFDGLPTVLAQADWLILACPLTGMTRGLVDERVLSALPPHAHVINVARGEIVHEPALIEALRARRLAGAFLDVFAHEPLAPDSPLWSLENVLVTPHAAGHSSGNFGRVATLFAENLRRWLTGEPLRHPAHIPNAI